jgi:hypothetical protein
MVRVLNFTKSVMEISEKELRELIIFSSIGCRPSILI